MAYGGSPIPVGTFVVFNMVSYADFVMTAMLLFRYKCRTLLIPVLFFVIYGTWGNAVSHTTWCAIERGYFPGGATAIIYFPVGALLLHRFVRNWRIVLWILIPFTIVLVSCALVFFHPAA